MNNELLTGWRKLPDYRGEELYSNDEREMMIFTTTNQSTLVKENEVHLEFTGDNHFSDAIKKCDEIWAEHYVIAH